jgi:hypothetical protein
MKVISAMVLLLTINAQAGFLMTNEIVSGINQTTEQVNVKEKKINKIVKQTPHNFCRKCAPRRYKRL